MPVSQHTAQAHQRPVDRPGNPVVFVLKRSLHRISFAIHTCSHQVSSTDVNSRVRRLFRPSFAFPCKDGSPSYLAMAYLLDVGSLSDPANLEPVSDRLQAGVRFFQHPFLHILGHSLRSACRSRTAYADRNDPSLLASFGSRGGRIGSYSTPADIKGFHVPL